MIVIRHGRAREGARRLTESEALFRALVLGAGTLSTGQRGVWRPPIEVYETDTALEIVAELAGMDREQIEVVIEGDTIEIRGVRPDPAVCDRRSYHEARIAYGHFAAHVRAPFAFDADSAAATYENGFLRISLPRLRSDTRRTLVPRPVTNGQQDADTASDEASGR